MNKGQKLYEAADVFLPVRGRRWPFNATAGSRANRPRLISYFPDKEISNIKVPFVQDQFKQLGITILPAFAAALVPKCPLCWMAILSSLGLGSAIGAAWLQPLTLFFLVVALLAIAYRARRRRAYSALILGISAAMIIYVSKFIFGLDAGTYLGGAALMGASLWNSRPAPDIAESIPCGCSGLNGQKIT